MKRTLKEDQPAFIRKNKKVLKAGDVIEVEVHTPTPMSGDDRWKEHHYKDQLKVVGESFYLDESDFEEI